MKESKAKQKEEEEVVVEKKTKPSADPKISVLISILETRHLFPVGTINCS